MAVIRSEPTPVQGGQPRTARWLVSLVVLGLIPVVVGLLLPGRVEVSRSTPVEATRGEVHAVLADLGGWSDWHPALRGARDVRLGTGADPSLEWTAADGGRTRVAVTASLPERGLWYDLSDSRADGWRVAVLYERDGGTTRVTWILSLELGGGPLGRWRGVGIPSRVGPEIESAVHALAGRFSR